MNKYSKLISILFIAFILSQPTYSQQALSRSGNPATKESLDLYRFFPCGGETIFEENFEGGNIPQSWQVFDFDGLAPFDSIANNIGSGWQHIIDFKDPSNHALASPSWYKDTVGKSDDWLISPQIAIEGNVCLSWFAYSQDIDFPENYEVRISTTTNDTAAFLQNEPLLEVFRESDRLNYRSVNLSQYSGENIYLAFRHTSIDKFILVLDDIRLAKIEMRDVAPFDLRIALENDSTNFHLIKGAIRNFGSDTLRADSILQVTYTINGIDPKVAIIDTFVLAPNDSIQFVHDSIWNAPTRGLFEICMWTSGVPDDLVENDTICRTVTFGPVVSIDDPKAQSPLSVFPNPVRQKLLYRLDAGKAIRLKRLRITDLYGREVYQQIEPHLAGEINISNLTPGIYFLKVEQAEGEALIHKFLKE